MTDFPLSNQNRGINAEPKLSKVSIRFIVFKRHYEPPLNHLQCAQGHQCIDGCQFLRKHLSSVPFKIGEELSKELLEKKSSSSEHKLDQVSKSYPFLNSLFFKNPQL